MGTALSDHPLADRASANETGFARACVDVPLELVGAIASIRGDVVSDAGAAGLLATRCDFSVAASSGHANGGDQFLPGHFRRVVI